MQFHIVSILLTGEEYFCDQALQYVSKLLSTSATARQGEVPQ